jgi:uncharacterized C2H2 Zn-finger protein
MVACNICNKVFGREHELVRHVKSIHQGHKFECDVCQISFNIKYNLIRHMKNAHRGADRAETPIQGRPTTNDQGIYECFFFLPGV